MTVPVTGPTTGVPLVRAHGDARTRGLRHGEARAAALHAFLDDGLARLNRILPAAVSMAGLRPRLAGYLAEIERATPELAEEIHGLAAGAGLDLEQAVLLQVRREIMGYQRIPVRGDCTTYARTGAGAGTGGPVLAQTVDLNGDLDEVICVLDVARPDPPRRALVLSFGGLLGYLGVNDAGLAVGLNLVLGGRWRPGLPPYLAIRHLLDTASGVEEAVEILRGLRLASSRSLTLCDAGGAAYVEIVDDDVRVVRSAEVTHTNHFLHPDLVPRDELNVFARNFSVRRLAACRAGLAALPAGAGVERHFALLATEPIRVAGDGDLRRERTVAAVVLRPGRGELHLRPGDPAAAATRSFALREERDRVTA